MRSFWRVSGHSVATFHSTKYQAQNPLGRRLIVYENGFYKIAWDPDCWFDVDVFEALLDGRGPGRQARLEQALALYLGDFLEGYDAEWCLPIRERLRMRYRDALIELGECHVGNGELSQALAFLRQAVAMDDLHEPAVRALMRLYALDGQTHTALDLFHHLERQLQQLHALPGRRTQSLYRSIQAGYQPSPHGLVSHPQPA